MHQQRARVDGGERVLRAGEIAFRVVRERNAQRNLRTKLDGRRPNIRFFEEGEPTLDVSASRVRRTQQRSQLGGMVAGGVGQQRCQQDARVVRPLHPQEHSRAQQRALRHGRPVALESITEHEGAFSISKVPSSPRVLQPDRRLRDERTASAARAVRLSLGR